MYLLTSAHSPFELRKALTSARMLSGRYPTDYLARHWSKKNPSGLCQLPGCDGDQAGTLQHLLLHCPALSDVRSRAIHHWASFLVSHEYLFPIITHHTLGPPDVHLQFLLDPSCLPTVIAANRLNGDILPSCFYLARTWVHTIHVRRTRLQKAWNLV